MLSFKWLGVSGGQSMLKQESLGVSGGQIMLTREWLGVGGGQIMLKQESLGVSGGQIMLTREWLGVGGGQIMLTHESLGVIGYTLGHTLCLFSLNATDVRCLCGFIGFLSPNGDDMPVWFQWAPAPGLAGAGAGAGIRSSLWPDHGQITTSVVLLGVQVTDVRRGYLGGRRRRRRD